MSNKPEPKPGSLAEALERGPHLEDWAARIADGQRAMSNVAPEAIDELENAIGTRALFESAFELGRHTQAGGLDGDITVDAIRAHAELQILKNDGEFMAKYGSGDLAARDRFQHLHQRAYPPELDEGGEE